MSATMPTKPRLLGPGFIATGNAGKLREIIPLCHDYFTLDKAVNGLAPEGAEESSETFSGNALIKAHYLHAILKARNERGPYWILADDSGISVDHLEGRPGVRSARYAGDHVDSMAHMEKMITELKGSQREPPHRAHYTCALALLRCNDEGVVESEECQEGQCHGEILFTPQGETGFGYDPIFFVPQFQKTFAQVSYEEKNSISHRRHAFDNLRKTLLLVVMFLGLGLSATPKAQAGSFSDLLLSWRSEGKLEIPALRPETPRPKSESLSELHRSSAEVKTLLELYANHLKKPASKLSWRVQLLATESQLPAARASRSFFNSHLLFAFDGDKELATFRPVDTSSGCDSGCAPITFHLVREADTKYAILLSDPEHPLLKKGHVALAEADLELLSKNLKTLPTLLRKLPMPGLSTNSDEQTWSLYSSTLVPGAAYTSYRVYEAAFQMLEALEFSDSAREASLNRASELLGESFRIGDSLKAGAKLKESLKKSVQKKNVSHIEDKLQGSLLAALIAWTFSEDPKATLTSLRRDIRDARLPETPALKCQILETLILDNKSRTRLAKLSSADIKECTELSQEWIRILSASKQTVESLAFLSKNSKTIPRFISKEPANFTELISSLPAAETQLRKELSSRLKALHPRVELSAEQFDATRVSEIENELKNETLAKLSAGLGKVPDASLKKFEKSVKFPVKGKEIYIFFASWCPHCKELLARLRTEIKDPKLWNKIQLVESLSDYDSLMEAQLLCARIGLPIKTCEEMLLLPSAREAPELNRRLNLTAVPRTIVTDSAGNILDFDFKFEEGAYADPLRKLKWVLEARP